MMNSSANAGRVPFTHIRASQELLQSARHVLSGLEVRLAGRFALRTELKFRNIQLETSQRFSAAVAVYRETTVPLPQEILRSRIQIDGMNLVAGIVYRLP